MDNAAEALRTAFDNLPDDHVFTLSEVAIVPAVLGDNITWSNASQDGVLYSVRAYDQEIRTAGDLRRVLVEHPRSLGFSDDDDGATALGKALRELIEKMTAPLAREITLNRIRIRSVFDVIDKASKGEVVTTSQLSDMVREAIERDFHPLMNAMTMAPEPFERWFGSWRKEDEAQHDAKFESATEAQKSREDWKAMWKRVNEQGERLASLSEQDAP